MINFLTTAPHRYTVQALGENFGAAVPPFRAFSYDELFSAEVYPSGTYVFTDFERLSDLELVLVADYFRIFKAQPGFTVLNDPARAQTRYGLIRTLKTAKFNAFDAYPADGHPRPTRFPVFVRAEAVHEHALTGLIPNQQGLELELDRLVRQNRPLRGLIVIEYCAEPVAPGVFRRYGSFNIGGQIHLDHIVSEADWNVKWGTSGLATEQSLRADDEAVRANQFATELATAFRLAGIDYGRADFGIVGGRPQIYEINTNPVLSQLTEHWWPVRMGTMLFAHKRFASLLTQVDTPQTSGIQLGKAAFTDAARRAADELRVRRQACRQLPDPRPHDGTATPQADAAFNR